MGQKPVDAYVLQQTVDEVTRHKGNVTAAAASLGLARSTVQSRMHRAELEDVTPSEEAITQLDREEGLEEDYVSELTEKIVKKLKLHPLTLTELAEAIGFSRGQALDLVERMKVRGVRISKLGDKYSVEGTPQPAYLAGEKFTFTSDKDNLFRFGIVSDTHLGSKYERLDVLDDLYDRFEKAGLDRVYHGGNWIEGEARFNKFDIHIYGMDNQCRYLAEHYPQRDGITTYAITGDDHEGWYAQREGVDIGYYQEQIMRKVGREDWINMGYMENHVKLINKNTGKDAKMSVVHAGGGSAYALSYSTQKIIESLESGEKPAMAIYGHFHKMWCGNIRNVWVVQPGCTKDQDPFMRKRRLAAHVGGVLCELEQDPETGAIISMQVKMLRYFNRDYYDNRWSHSSPVVLPKRDTQP